MLSCTRDAQETTQKVDSDTGHGTTASFAENIRPLGGKRQFVATESAHNCQGICHRSLLRDVASARADDYLCRTGDHFYRQRAPELFADFYHQPSDNACDLLRRIQAGCLAFGNKTAGR